MDLNEFLPSLKYGATVSGDLTFANSGGTITLGQGLPFIASASVGTAAMFSSAGVTLLADSVVTNNRSVYLQGFIIKNGATQWYTAPIGGGSITIEDSAGTAFVYSNSTGTIHMEANQVFTIASGTMTSVGALNAGTGGTPAKGLRMKSNGSIFSGSTLSVTVWGIIK